jgi:AcrR family transcriptional regulator
MPRLKAEQRRAQLLEVARSLFARSGFEATTTASIAHAAGVTEPILYRHFRGKQELFVAIVRSISQQTLEHFSQVLASTTDPAAQIRAIGQATPDHIRRHADSYHVLHGALANLRDKRVATVVREHYQKLDEFFAAIVRQGQESGAFRADIDPHAAACQFVFTGIGYAMISLNVGTIDTKVIDGVIDSIVRGLR